jgi:hypothetical protein
MPADVLRSLFWRVATKSLTFFCHHVGDIILRRPSPKVVGINTCWIIATMANGHPFWYSSIVQFIRHPMGGQVCHKATR